ncbi:MAG TPA: regulatory iron-sulfur-containing complex subunit RicT [Gemmatimonadales bacterium]|nr:regulatory iron-sulfur-containing complex subunit RicT [Gemmatimonadales bacterium]
MTVQLVEVRFKGNRKGYYRWTAEEDPLRLEEKVIVEAERGHDLGRVSAAGESAEKKCGSCAGCERGATPAPSAQPAVVRRATQEDVKALNDLRRTEDEARRKVAERVRHHQLLMKVSDTEWQWDRNKLTIYFTAEKRVDFRALVRDLASQFRTRIDLHQIGVRDEAARLTGVGRCGREYCCSTWLTELSPVNLALAKDQHLSLNPQQISGGCGRLLCCLKYEHEFYVASRMRFPKEGKTVTTAIGAEKVVAVDIFRERVFLRSEQHGPRIITLADLKTEIELLGETLPLAESRPRPSAPAPGPAARPADAAPATAGDRPRRRRRGRRGRGGAGPGAPPPSAPES